MRVGNVSKVKQLVGIGYPELLEALRGNEVSIHRARKWSVRWTTPLRFDRRKLMHMWRYAVITYLRVVLKKGLLVSEAGPEELRSDVGNAT